MYIVKKEVLATNIAQALKAKSTVYSIELAAPEYQPLPKKKPIGIK